MKLRELLIGIGFKIDEQSVNLTEKKIENVKRGLDQVGNASATSTTKASKGFAGIGTAADATQKKSTQALAKIEAKAKDTNNELTKTTALFNKVVTMVGLAGILVATLSFGNIIKVVDELKTISGQVRLVTSSQKEAAAVQEGLYKMAQRTRQEYGATAQLYTSVARNASELGKSTSDILAFTEDVSMAMMIGGGSAASQQAALVQLGQALGSGVLRGDELNSIMEQAPRLSKLIADGLGTTVGKLRELGKEGKLTAVDIFDAIRNGSAQLKMEMGKIPWTVDQASIKMRNSMQRFFAGVEARTGVVSSIAEGFAKMSDYIDSIDIDGLVAGFRLLMIYASAFFVVSQWSTLLMGMRLLKNAVLEIKDAYLLATGAQVVFRSGGMRSVAMAIVPLAKLALIAAVIALVILALQDLYVWIKGGDSIVGRHFGTWENFINELSRRWEQWKDEFSKSIAPLVSAAQPFINVFRNILNWIDGCIARFEAFQAKIAEWNPRQKLSELGNWAENIYFGNPSKNQGTGYLEKSVSQSNSSSFADQSTHTNNVTVYAKTNAAPADIGNEVVNAITPNYGRSGFDIASGFDAGHPSWEGS